jgi:threonine/homoserine/homoserine lactone efflux protein
MLGLSAVMQAGAIVFEAVRWARVAYLVFMGASMIRNAGAASFDGQGPEDTPTGPMGPVM